MRAWPCLAFLFLAVAAAAAPSGNQAVRDPMVERLVAIQALDQRVANAAYRLKRAGRAECAILAHDIGVSLHSSGSYLGAFRDAAERRYALRRGPALLAVAAGGPAARAGLLPDDILLTIDAVIPPTDAPEESGVARVSQSLDAALDDGIAIVEIERGGMRHHITVAAELNCASRVTMLPARSISAAADGRVVQISSALVDYAGDDDRLATVLAHELSHNFLQHRVRLDAAGIDRGVFGGFGRSGRLSREAEIEADRLGIRIMARAGYEPTAAIAFWEAYRRDLGLGIFRSGTHPSERARLAAIREEIQALIQQPPVDDTPLQ